jgi:hypothetical protein
VVDLALYGSRWVCTMHVRYPAHVVRCRTMVRYRETGRHGVDEDWAVGEVVLAEGAVEPEQHVELEGDGASQRLEEQEQEQEELRLRYCRVYFDAQVSTQQREKSTGARFGWDMPSVVNI